MTRFNANTVVLLSFVVAGCAGVRVGPEQAIKVGTRTVTVSGLEGFNAAAVRKPDPNYVLVFVFNGGIVIDQEPVRPPRPSGEVVTITWALDSDGPNKFPESEAITFPPVTGSDRNDARCTPFPPKYKSVVCTYTNPGRPQQYKYMIRVLDGSGTAMTLDPWIQQP